MQFLMSSVWLSLLTETTHADFTFHKAHPVLFCIPALASPIFHHQSHVTPPLHNCFKNACFYCPVKYWSVTMPASPARRPVCASPLLFYSPVNTLWLNVFAPPRVIIYIFEEKRIWNKGNAAQRGMIFGTLLMWFSMYHRDLFSFYYPFWMCMIVCLWELCVTLYARGSSLVVLLYVCVCVIRETTLNLLIW